MAFIPGVSYENAPATLRMLEVLRAFEHEKLLQRPFKRPSWRPKKSTTYKYDPNKSDTVTIYEDLTKWRQ